MPAARAWCHRPIVAGLYRVAVGPALLFNIPATVIAVYVLITAFIDTHKHKCLAVARTAVTRTAVTGMANTRIAVTRIAVMLIADTERGRLAQAHL